jgi:HNH endonuclease
MRRDWCGRLWSYNSGDAAALQAYNLHQNPPFRTRTNFCHIFPPSTNWGFNPNNPVEKNVILFSSIICYLSFNVLQKKYAGAVWAIINNFRSIDILTQLDGENIHSLENGFTMDMGLHGLFDDLHLWFEHIAVSG